MLRAPRSASHARKRQKISSVSVDPTGWKAGSRSASTRCLRLPLWPTSQSRPPYARQKGWVLASLMLPQVAVRMCKTKIDDSRCSQALTSSLRMDPCGGAGSLSTEAEGSPPG